MQHSKNGQFTKIGAIIKFFTNEFFDEWANKKCFNSAAPFQQKHLKTTFTATLQLCNGTNGGTTNEMNELIRLNLRGKNLRPIALAQ